MDSIQHFGHPEHLLSRVKYDNGKKCFGCKSGRRDRDHQAMYGCSECDYFLHKSCAELPPKIYLPIHRDHREGFVLYIAEEFQCKKCGIHMKDDYNFCFWCEQCGFWICFKCAGVRSSRNIEYEDHPHPLRLVDNVEDTASFLTQCNGYDSYCTQRLVTSSDEFKKTESTMLWCFHCDFKVHLLCAPLPGVIRHEFHIHSLVLVDSLAEDDSGEYYCDVCETKRDPRIRLYCCLECKYFAHLHCVIPEVSKVLSGEHGDVELKTLGHHIWNKPGRELKIERADMTLKDVINGLPEDEKHILRNYYEWDEKKQQEDVEEGDEEEIEEILQLSHFTHQSFQSFLCNLQDYSNSNKVELKWSDLSLKIVKVKAYMIPQFLAPVLNTLLCEFGDIGSGSTRSAGFNSFVIFVICKVVKRMNDTIPKCITKNLIQEWYCHLKFANNQSFQVMFAGKQLEGLVDAFLGFQGKRLGHEIPTILTQKIAELQRKLEVCNQFGGSSSSKSEYQEYCFKMCSDLEWKQTAFTGSFPQNSEWGVGILFVDQPNPKPLPLEPRPLESSALNAAVRKFIKERHKAFELCKWLDYLT